MANDTAQLQEVAIAPLVQLAEAKAVSPDGEISIKVIKPGQGSTGFYPAETIQRDGPKVATRGLHMYWNHPTVTEAKERPERSLGDLAAVFTTDAAYDAQGPSGPGLYAKAKVFDRFRDPLNEIAGEIGVSIRGSGRIVERELDGEVRQVVEELTALDSVDFVTKPGAGGQIVSIFEAARSGSPNPKPAADEPVAETTNQQQEVHDMDEKALQEAQGQITALQAKLAEADKRDAANTARLNRMEARSIVESALSGHELPQVVSDQIRDEVAANPALTESGEVDAAKVREAVQARVQQAYKTAEAFGARVKVTESGSEPPKPATDEDIRRQLAESQARRLGISAENAKAAWGVN
jgi:hypothetical protein